MDKQEWLVAVAYWGVVDFAASEKEAEEWRANKARWEASPAKKIKLSEFKSLSKKEIDRHWAYRMMENHLQKQKIDQLAPFIKENLTDDMLKPAQSGHCYVASETLYHLLGGKEAGLKPMNIKHEGAQHWFLKDKHGNVLDITKDQFKTPVPYDKARGRGFLTKTPSKRTTDFIYKLLGKALEMAKGELSI